MDVEGNRGHSQRPTKRAPLMIALVASALLFALLGVWQIERRTEKLALIAAAEQRVHAPPESAPGPGSWPRITFKEYAYRHVRVRGEFLQGRATLVQGVTGLGAGYWAMSPLKTEAGWIILVNRGFVRADNRDRDAWRRTLPAGPTSVTGLLRITEPKGGLLHSNDPLHDRWYSRDVAAIGRARQLGSLAPYFIDADRVDNDGAEPIGGLTVVSFPNNHLPYALTWFALTALSLFGLVRLGGKAGR